METTQTTNESLNVTRQQLLSLVYEMIGGYPNPDDAPSPPGPWDPIIRGALEHINAFGPFPEPWRSRFGVNQILKILANLRPEIWDLAGGGRSILDEVALNPQPLPPRIAFAAALVRGFINHAVLMREIAEIFGFEQRGIIIVSGRDLSQWIDELCGNNFKIKFPIRKPRPPWWSEKLAAIDFFVMANEFEQAAAETFNEDLRANFADPGAKLSDAGLSRIRGGQN